MNCKPGIVSGFLAPREKIRGWKKSYGYFALEPDGTIFLSWAHTGCSKMEAFLCASYDGEPVITLHDVPMFRAEWISENFPNMKRAVAAATRRIAIAQETGQPPFDEP
jgi:hypothetical protein